MEARQEWKQLEETEGKNTKTKRNPWLSTADMRLTLWYK